MHLQEVKGFFQVEFDIYPVKFLSGNYDHLHSKYTKINSEYL